MGLLGSLIPFHSIFNRLTVVVSQKPSWEVLLFIRGAVMKYLFAVLLLSTAVLVSAGCGNPAAEKAAAEKAAAEKATGITSSEYVPPKLLRISFHWFTSMFR